MKLRSDFRTAVTILNRLHRESGEERSEPIPFHQYQRWHSSSSSSTSWWQWIKNCLTRQWLEELVRVIPSMCHAPVFLISLPPSLHLSLPSSTSSSGSFTSSSLWVGSELNTCALPRIRSLALCSTTRLSQIQNLGTDVSFGIFVFSALANSNMAEFLANKGRS